jgi:hypothetical protein
MAETIDGYAVGDTTLEIERGAALTVITPAKAADDKPKRVRRTKAEIAAAEAATEDGGDAATDGDDGLGLGDDDDDESEDEEKLTLDGDIIPACQKLLKAAKDPAAGKAKLSKILGTFGVKSVRDLKVEQYADALKKLKH